MRKQGLACLARNGPAFDIEVDSGDRRRRGSRLVGARRTMTTGNGRIMRAGHIMAGALLVRRHARTGMMTAGHDVIAATRFGPRGAKYDGCKQHDSCRPGAPREFPRRLRKHVRWNRQELLLRMMKMQRKKQTTATLRLFRTKCQGENSLLSFGISEIICLPAGSLWNNAGVRAMIPLPAPSAVQKIEVFSWWVGFSDPPSRAAKLTITNTGGRFFRQRALEPATDELPARDISRVLEALARPAVPSLDPALFDLPAGVIERHYGSMWTDDGPSHLVRIVFDSGRLITITTEAQHAFMLPFTIADSEADAPYDTYDPEFSRCLADLMPDGYPDRDRLAGRLWMLESDLAEAERQQSETVPDGEAVAEPAEPDTNGPAAASSLEEWDAAISRIFLGVESPEEVEAAEQAGQLSERLLKFISLETTKDVLARGANPSIADDAGQTALMHAMFHRNAERFRLLVEAGADLEARRNDGLTGLHLSCCGGEADAVAEWVQAGADGEARAPGGATPLMLGAEWPRIVRTLLDHSADINATDDDGHPALVYVIHRQSVVSEEQQLESLKFLIDAGTDVNLKDRKGLPPLSHAKAMVAKVLLDEEVRWAFRPQGAPPADTKSGDLKLAETIVAMLIGSGAHD